MKYKEDFITNSSSSSFIVVFPTKIVKLEDVHKYMSERKAQTVFRDAQEQEPIEIKFSNQSEKVPLFNKIFEILSNNLSHNDGVVPQIVSEIVEAIETEYPGMLLPMEVTDYLLTRLRNLNKQTYYYEPLDISKEDLLDLLKRCEKKGFIYYFHYSDECGQHELEHGGTFDELPHIQVSHH